MGIVFRRQTYVTPLFVTAVRSHFWVSSRGRFLGQPPVPFSTPRSNIYICLSAYVPLMMSCLTNARSLASQYWRNIIKEVRFHFCVQNLPVSAFTIPTLHSCELRPQLPVLIVIGFPIFLPSLFVPIEGIVKFVSGELRPPHF